MRATISRGCALRGGRNWGSPEGQGGRAGSTVRVAEAVASAMRRLRLLSPPVAPRPSASARPAIGGRYAPTGAGTGLRGFMTSAVQRNRSHTGGETRCVSFSRPAQILPVPPRPALPRLTPGAARVRAWGRCRPSRPRPRKIPQAPPRSRPAWAAGRAASLPAPCAWRPDARASSRSSRR